MSDEITITLVKVNLCWAAHWHVVAQHWDARRPDFHNHYSEAIGQAERYLFEAERLMGNIKTQSRGE